MIMKKVKKESESENVENNINNNADNNAKDNIQHDSEYSHRLESNAEDPSIKVKILIEVKNVNNNIKIIYVNMYNFFILGIQELNRIFN